jgi:hypothetical protein
LGVTGGASGFVGVCFSDVLFAAALVVGFGFAAGFGTVLAVALGGALAGVRGLAFGAVFAFGAALGLGVGVASGFAVLLLVCRLFGFTMKPYLLVLPGVRAFGAMPGACVGAESFLVTGVGVGSSLP